MNKKTIGFIVTGLVLVALVGVHYVTTRSQNKAPATVATSTPASATSTAATSTAPENIYSVTMTIEKTNGTTIFRTIDLAYKGDLPKTQEEMNALYMSLNKLIHDNQDKTLAGVSSILSIYDYQRQSFR